MPQKYRFERVPGPCDTLPESPCWHGSTHRLFWIDHGSRDLRSVRFPEREFFAVPLETKGNLRFVKSLNTTHLIVASECGLYRFGIEERQLTPIGGALPLSKGTCLNDGAVHPSGTIAIAVSDIDESDPTGGFYVLSGDDWTCIRRNIVIGNGPAFSSDGQTLFLSDTLGKRILRHDLATGEQTVDIDLSKAEGFPDGLFMSDKGDLWVSFWDGARIEAYRGGLLQRQITPTPGFNATCCCEIQDAACKLMVLTICDSRREIENGAYIASW